MYCSTAFFKKTGSSLASSSESALYSWRLLNSILNQLIPSSAITTFLVQNNRSSLVACFLINSSLILLLLSRKISHLYAVPFGLRFLDLLRFLSPPSGFTSYQLHSPTLKIYFHQTKWMFVYDHMHFVNGFHRLISLKSTLILIPTNCSFF